MEMNQPAPRNPIDENRNGLIGKPINRVDGRLKVMGLAPYAHEVKEGANAACGFIVEATIAKGAVPGRVPGRVPTRTPHALKRSRPGWKWAMPCQHQPTRLTATSRA